VALCGVTRHSSAHEARFACTFSILSPLSVSDNLLFKTQLFLTEELYAIRSSLTSSISSFSVTAAPNSQQHATRRPGPADILPSKEVLKLHGDTHKAISSIIVQLRTGNIGMKAFLHDRHVPGFESPLCECGTEPESVRHVFLSCPLNVEDRSTLLDEVGPLDLIGSLADRKRAAVLARWFMRSGRVQYYGVARRLIDDWERSVGISGGNVED